MISKKPLLESEVDTMDLRHCYYAPAPSQNAIGRREFYAYGDRKVPRCSDDYRLPSRGSFRHMPYSDGRVAYPGCSQFHSYYNFGRFPLSRRLPIESYQMYPDGPLSYQRNRFAKEFTSCSKNVYKGYRSKPYGEGIKAAMLPLKDNFIQSTVKFEENVAEPDSSIVNPCLSRRTQRMISRLQNDFRLSKKYKTFVMYELPLIAEFKPTPAITTDKLHNRFKCSIQQFLDVNDYVDLDSEPEKDPKEEDVPKNAMKVTK